MNAEERRRRGTPDPSSDEARRRMEATRRRDTAAEIAVRRRLHAKGLRYRINYRIALLPRRRADIAFPKQRVAVFVDGCFWHGCPKHGTMPKANRPFWKEKITTNRRRDKDTNRRLRGSGWLAVRVWEHEYPEIAARRVASVVRERAREWGR